MKKFGQRGLSYLLICIVFTDTGFRFRVEIAVKQILCGMNVKTSASVANAECLDWYREWARNN